MPITIRRLRSGRIAHRSLYVERQRAGLLRRSNSNAIDPDLFVFALATHFQGYFPLYFSFFEPVRDGSPGRP